MGVLDDRDMLFGFADFDDGSVGWLENPDTSGVLNPYDIYHGGWYEIETSATAGRIPSLILGTAAVPNAAVFPEDTAGVWYMAMRLGFPVAVTTAETAGGIFQKRTATGTIVGRLGKIAGNANYAYQGDSGSLIDSGILITNDIRVIEAVRVGGTTYLYVDEVLKGSGNTFPTELSVPQLVLTNGAEAANKIMLFDWAAWGFKTRKTGTVA